jgi:hypothetical protein
MSAHPISCDCITCNSTRERANMRRLIAELPDKAVHYAAATKRKPTVTRTRNPGAAPRSAPKKPNTICGKYAHCRTGCSGCGKKIYRKDWDKVYTPTRGFGLALVERKHHITRFTEGWAGESDTTRKVRHATTHAVRKVAPPRAESIAARIAESKRAHTAAVARTE